MAASRAAFAGLAWSAIGERARAREPAPAPAGRRAAPHVAAGEPPTGTVVVGYRELMCGPTVDHSPALHFQRRTGIEISHDDAQALGVTPATGCASRYDGARARRAPRSCCGGCAPASSGWRARVPYVGPGDRRGRARGGGRMPDGFIVTVIKSLVLVNLVMVVFAFLTWLERRLIGRFQVRLGPNRVGPFGLLQPIADLGQADPQGEPDPRSASAPFLYLAAPVISLFAR